MTTRYADRQGLVHRRVVTRFMSPWVACELRTGEFHTQFHSEDLFARGPDTLITCMVCAATPSPRVPVQGES